MLLDNECILHDVHAYLAAQALGTITPHTMSQHVNEVILPALQIKGMVLESTAQHWLRFKLGYQCKELKKGLYVDGHEHPDVIKERNDFIEQISNRYERYVGCVQCSKPQRLIVKCVGQFDGKL